MKPWNSLTLQNPAAYFLSNTLHHDVWECIADTNTITSQTSHPPPSVRSGYQLPFLLQLPWNALSQNSCHYRNQMTVWLTKLNSWQMHRFVSSESNQTSLGIYPAWPVTKQVPHTCYPGLKHPQHVAYHSVPKPKIHGTVHLNYITFMIWWSIFSPSKVDHITNPHLKYWLFFWREDGVQYWMQSRLLWATDYICFLTVTRY
jgi:hypothetical protein